MLQRAAEQRSDSGCNESWWICAGNHSTLQHKFTNEEWKNPVIPSVHEFTCDSSWQFKGKTGQEVPEAQSVILALHDPMWVHVIQWWNQLVSGVCVIQRLCSPLPLHTLVPMSWWRCQQMERGVSMCHTPASEGWASFSWSVLTHFNIFVAFLCFKKEPGWS